MTDFERELRAILIEVGERAPVVEDLVSRAATPVRRRRTWLASGLAAATMAAVGVTIAVTTPAGNEPAGVSTSSTSASTQTQAEALLGSWRPVDIVGFDNSKLPPSGPPAADRAPNIGFTSDGRWHGSDGCNGIGGTYRAGDDGSISADAGPQHLIGCDNVPNSIVLQRAVRFAIDGRSLTFSAADGQRLGTYERV
ncbi:META domain-containing protein [Kribbella caucasensis]|nr:META domain-containing protein [Kribbella sp. VKM Ac-2527]